MRIPCLKKRGLKIFTPTADQRYLLGEELFLRTHFPVTFRRFRGETLIETWSEQDILSMLKEDKSIGEGNRVFILFGAAGSGKSESIRWLELYLNKEKCKKETFRISRTELDPVLILNKLMKMTGDSLDRRVLIKWDALKKKPVALANTLVWNALNAMLDSDEKIIPLSYKLRPLVENNLRRSFLGGECYHEGKVDLLLQEEWEEAKRECAINFNLEYEQFRKRLVDRFETEVMGGYSFVDVLRVVGERIETETGQRPVLLVDDLVQSMSIYSSDLLDFFITLDEGNWDIVIGLTPASFESSKRGRELLGRINHLDTFDDRIYKLWLTDEFGQESYTLDNVTVTGYLCRYLAEYKRLNGHICGRQCENYTRCIQLHWGCEEDVVLTPLNAPLVNRMFDNLFKGKGQSRHIIVSVLEYLSAILSGDTASFLADRVNREVITDIEELDHKIIIESYLPLGVEGEVTIPKGFLNVLGYENISNKHTSITRLNPSETDVTIDFPLPAVSEPRPELVALRDWLEGRDLNKELLRPFRFSCNAFLREFLPKSGLVRPHTPRSQGTVRYDKVTEGCRYPLAIERVDRHTGIHVYRALGTDAFRLFSLKELGGEAQRESINRLWSRFEVSDMFAEASRIVLRWREGFENNIGMKCEELAFLLYVFAFHIHPYDSYPQLIDKHFNHCTLRELPPPWDEKVVLFTEETANFVADFFKDWFQLRENFYDALLMQAFINRYPGVDDVLNALVTLEPKKIDSDYKAGNISLRDVLTDIVSAVQSRHEVFSSNRFQDDCNEIISNLTELISLRDDELLEIGMRIERIENTLIKLGKITALARPPSVTSTIPLPGSPSFPGNISFITKHLKDPGYNWLKSLKNQLYHIFEEHEKIYRSYTETFPGLEKKAAGLCHFDNMDIKSMLVAVETSAGVALAMISKINTLNSVRDCIAPDYLATIKDFASFLHDMLNYIEIEQQESLGLNQTSRLVNDYLDELHLIESMGELTADRELLRDVFVRLSKDRIRSLKKKMCSVLINQVRTSIHSGDSERQYLWGDKTLIKFLTLTGKGKYHDYPSLSARLKKRRGKSSQSIECLTKNLSKPAAKMVEDLFEKNRVRLKVNDYLLLGELSTKVPRLAGTLECEVVLKK